MVTIIFLVFYYFFTQKIYRILHICQVLCKPLGIQRYFISVRGNVVRRKMGSQRMTNNKGGLGGKSKEAKEDIE